MLDTKFDSALIMSALQRTHNTDPKTGELTYRNERVTLGQLSVTVVDKLWRLANRSLIRQRVAKTMRKTLKPYVRDSAIQEGINALASYEYAVNWLENHSCRSMTTEERDYILLCVKHHKQDLERLDDFKLDFEHLTV